ncbi:MAG TPA: hypothetical protein VN282_17780 [Pyrinomonadaceae bacterium]|nr:hypothetical protein [Pyrinomonadaceae bacterium]
MSRNYSRAAADAVRKRRRRNSLLVSAVAVIVIIVLLTLEQVALLYLISTLGVVALLLVVAFSDLHGAQQPASALGAAPADDAAAIADGITNTATGAAVTTTFGSAAPRRPRRRPRR